MKKIFSIISAVICGLVIVFISTLSFIKTNVAIIQNNPVSIYVFNESTTATKANGYTKDNAEFNEILKNPANDYIKSFVCENLNKKINNLKRFVEITNGKN